MLYQDRRMSHTDGIQLEISGFRRFIDLTEFEPLEIVVSSPKNVAIARSIPEVIKYCK